MTNTSSKSYVCTSCGQESDGPAKTTFFMSKRVKCPSCGTEFSSPAGPVVRVVLWIGFLWVLASIPAGYIAYNDYLRKAGRQAVQFGDYVGQAWFQILLVALLAFAIVKDMLLRSDRAAARRKAMPKGAPEPNSPQTE